MAISDIYATKVLEDIIRGYLEQGTVPTIEQITEDYDAFISTNDIDAPLFDFNDYTVERNESSSASKGTNTFTAIKQDMDILIQAAYQTAQKSTRLFNRWSTKADKIENRIIDMNARIGRLLTITEDTSGFFDSVGDKFTDTSKIDLDLSSNIEINLEQNIVTMSKDTGASGSVTRVFLNDLSQSQSRFSLITNNSKIIRTTKEKNTAGIYAFYDEERFWKNHVYTSEKVTPLLAELTLSLTEAIDVSVIRFKLHSSESNSGTIITPLYSTDGINYNRLPTTETTLETLGTAEFVFPELSATHFKFILEKQGHDLIDGSGFYIYEFGAKEIAFFKEGFSSDSDSKGTMVSKPLSLTDSDGSLVTFNKVTLDVCESVPNLTKLDYFVAVARDLDGEPSWLTTTGFSTDPIVGGVDTRLWSPISPTSRDESLAPELLDFASLSDFSREGISLSYDRDGGGFTSPAQTFNVMTTTTVLTGTDEAATNTAGTDNRRYFMPRTSNKILDLQIEKDVNLDLRKIVLWRNVGSKGITPGDTAEQVRGIQKGWEYNAPFYSTVINIENSQGLTIDVGNNPIRIDNVNYTGVIGPNVLSKGTHKVRIHKDYWREVPPSLTSLSALQAADVLYPYNQKLLIEGYQYDSAWTEEVKYNGVDRFAGLLCDRVGVFDMIHNIQDTDYSKFALDTDAPATSTFDDPPNEATPLSYVFLINSNSAVADFMNEEFVLEFNLTDELYSYIALKAELSTESTLIGPVFDEYKIKLGS